MYVVDLQGVLEKLFRAKAHFEELSKSISAYIESRSIQVYKEVACDGEIIYRIRFNKEIPREWSAIVGDVIHNSRTALDHLVWQMVLENGQTPDENTAFPILKSDPGTEWKARTDRKLRGVSDAAERYVRRLRPFPGGNAILHRLHRLDIADKHHEMLLVGSSFTHFEMVHSMSPIEGQEKGFQFRIPLRPAEQMFPLADGIAVFSISPEAIPDEDSGIMFHEPQFRFDIAFADIDQLTGLALLPTLHEMFHHVVRICAFADAHFFAQKVFPPSVRVPRSEMQAPVKEALGEAYLQKTASDGCSATNGQ